MSFFFSAENHSVLSHSWRQKQLCFLPCLHSIQPRQAESDSPFMCIILAKFVIYSFFPSPKIVSQKKNCNPFKMINQLIQFGIFTPDCDPVLLFDSFQESEVQIVLAAIKEPFVVDEDEVSGIVAPPDAFQLNVGLVPTFSTEAKLHAQIFMPRLESTAAGIQTLMNLGVKSVGSVIV